MFRQFSMRNKSNQPFMLWFPNEKRTVSEMQRTFIGLQAATITISHQRATALGRSPWEGPQVTHVHAGQVTAYASTIPTP